MMTISNRGRSNTAARCLLSVLLGVLLSGAAVAAVLHVDDDSTAAWPDGTLAAPFPTIQQALNAADPGDRVEVSEGIYRERVIMRGGIDLVGAGPDVTFIDVTGLSGRGVTFKGVRQNPRFEGFTITGGTGDQSGDLGGFPITIGGAMLISGSDPLVTNNHIVGNEVTNGYCIGGAIYVLAGGVGPTIMGNVISGNTAKSADIEDSGTGGAIYVSTKNASVVITDNTIESNTAVRGGAIYSENITNASVTIARNLILNNEAKEGGAILSRDLENSTTTIVNNVMAGNGSSDGIADCDDLEANSNPGLEEICNDGLDNDCNPATPDVFDADGDGYLCDVDCNDANTAIHPGAGEHCGDQIDNDCDGSIDWSNPDNLVLTEFGSSMRYLANSADPAIGLDWVIDTFDDSAWTDGTYGVGYEDTTPGAENLIQTTVPSGVASVYTRTTFNVENTSLVNAIFVGADWDDGYVMWINGVEVHRSAEMPAGDPAWNALPTEHESSNGADPDYGTLVDVSSDGIPLLVDGENVLAVGVWNETSAGGDDLVLVPRLSISYGLDDTNCLCDDLDSDGYTTDAVCGGDCNESDPAINPGQAEICNDAIDNDCNAATIDVFDTDSDSYNCATDCDDGNAAVNPGTAEVSCDDIDNDCNPLTLDVDDLDSDFYDCDVDCNDDNPAIHPGVVEFCYDETDNNCDGFIDAEDLECSCGDPVDNDSDGYRCTDCNDADPNVNPSRSEVCNDSIDNDCDEATPDIFDGDSDGYVCDAECDDFDPTVNPGVYEICNDGKDNDCDGDSDGADADCACADADSDGYATDTVCGTDCNDSDPLVNPGQAEICDDGIDNDCDSSGTPDLLDGDSDGSDCTLDCDDTDALVFPGAAEHCTDRKDNDCDTLIDLEQFDLPLVQFASPMKYLANLADPGIGIDWVDEFYDDSAWSNGLYGVGYQVGPPGTGADALLLTYVPEGTGSVYTRARFEITELAGVAALYVGADYDDGYVMWLNGTEVARAPEMPPGTPVWDANPALHESSNGEVPDYGTLIDISTTGIPLLHEGVNVLAVGLYNDIKVPASSDLVIVPRLSMDFGSDDPDCACLDGDEDGYACTDCDDTSAEISPAADEVGCDQIDNDCDAGTPDILDGDSDGYDCDYDCNDALDTVHPDATEIHCDFLDNDCFGGTPDVVDADIDTFDCLLDCDDDNADVNPNAPEVPCDGIDNDCSTRTADILDGDGDGYLCDAECDDTDPAVNPDAAEHCTDGIDNDCDSDADSSDTADCSCDDLDSDGYQCLDCNDARPDINPGVLEVCNDTLDNDCDSSTVDVFDRDDDGFDCLADCDDDDPFVRPNAAEFCNDGKDNDCDSSTLDLYDADTDGFTCDVDCRDIDPLVNPGQAEICNDAIDNDCDPATLDVSDGDSDGFDCSFDCEDLDSSINPGADEVCNDTIDNDCDPGTPDVYDADSDGSDCVADCDDGDGLRSPGFAEKCDDGIDNDCDGDSDGDDPDCGCDDADSDGYATDAVCGTDCNDGDATVNPGALEVCNDGIDNDCDSSGTPDVADLDSDGIICTSDCDDHNPAAYPGGTEICGDGADNDCNVSTPDLWDNDSDGAFCDTDCNDSNAAVNPGVAEAGCDGVDNDCDPATTDLPDADSDGYGCIDLTVRGGGVSATAFSNGVVFLLNNTVASNSLPQGAGGGIWIDDLLASIPSIVANNVVYGNTALFGGGIDHTGLFGELRNNSVFGNTGGDLYNAAGSTALEVENQFADPLIESAAAVNYRLRGGSPAIDAADPSYAPTNDFDRIDRPYDGDGDSSALPDIGAYEYPSGEVFELIFTDTDTLDWEVLPAHLAYNLYRGRLRNLKLHGQYTQDPSLSIPDQWCYIDPVEVPYVDTYTPASGGAVFYLVTSTAPGFEGSLGHASSGALRSNDWPCP